MPSSAGGVSGSRSGAPQPPGAERRPGLRGCAPSVAALPPWPGPARRGAPRSFSGCKGSGRTGDAAPRSRSQTARHSPARIRCREPLIPSRAASIPSSERHPRHRLRVQPHRQPRPPLCATLSTGARHKAAAVPSSPSQPYAHAQPHSQPCSDARTAAFPLNNRDAQLLSREASPLSPREETNALPHSPTNAQSYPRHGPVLGPTCEHPLRVPSRPQTHA